MVGDVHKKNIGTFIRSRGQNMKKLSDFYNWLNNLSVDIWVFKIRFPKMYIFGGPVKSAGPLLVPS